MELYEARTYRLIKILIKKGLFLIFFIQLILAGIGGSIVGPIIPLLTDYFKVGLDVIGSSLSLYAFGILLASLLTGILSEKFGEKNIFILGSILFTVSFLGLFFAVNFIYFTISYILFGVSWGLVYANSISIVLGNTKLNKSRVILRLTLGIMIGAITSPILIYLILLMNISWKYLFLSVAVINLILLIIILAFKPGGLNNKKSNGNFLNQFTNKKKLFLNLVIVLCGIIAFLHMGSAVTFGSWFTTYFKSLNFPLSTSSLMFSLFCIFISLGMFLKSFLVVKFGDKKVIQFFSILAFIFFATSIFLDSLILKIIFILLFGFSFSGITEAVIVISINQFPRYSGPITGIIVSFGYIGVIIFQYTTGYLTEKFSENSIIYVVLFALFLLIIFIIFLSFYSKFKKNQLN